MKNRKGSRERFSQGFLGAAMCLLGLYWIWVAKNPRDEDAWTLLDLIQTVFCILGFVALGLIAFYNWWIGLPPARRRKRRKVERASQ